ncbi:MAG: hypothetical protein ACPIA7_03890, partial [Akkermansiaceae bacterium]
VPKDENEVRAHTKCVHHAFLIFKFPEEETCSLAQPNRILGNPVSPTIFLWKMLPTREASLQG